jgi:pentatricopeptide repeat protein
MKTMEEKGVAPNIVTYNSLIKPLCRARKVEEAKGAFDDMLQRCISPTIRTYHAFLRILRTGEEVFALLEKMRKMGCQPINDTYIMLIRKFCRWRQLENVFKLWDEMSENGISPDRSSYIVLIHGLFLNGELDAAHKYYTEMKEKQLLPEPKIDEMLQTWLSNKQIAEGQTTESRSNQCQTTELRSNQLDCSQSREQTRGIPKRSHERNFIRQAETRKVVRERGFSFWEP